MAQNVFTHEQALEICEDFSDLEGTELVIHTDRPIKCEIDHVCIAPASRAEKELFIDSYHTTNDIKAAMATYKGSFYDVVIIAKNIDNPSEIIIQTINEYITTNGIRYNFPK